MVELLGDVPIAGHPMLGLVWPCCLQASRLRLKPIQAATVAADMKAAGAAVLFFLLAACGQAQAGPATSPIAAATATPAAVATASPSPNPNAQPSIKPSPLPKPVTSPTLLFG